MDKTVLLNLLQSVADGKEAVNNAADSLSHLIMEDIDYAHIDHQRSTRKGFPEVIFGQNKTAGQISGIISKMSKQENIILATRVNPVKAADVIKTIPKAVYHKDARMIILKKKAISIKAKGNILVLSAGTSDIPVAKEAYLTAKAMGNQVEYIFDVGVAGIHRLFAHKDLIEKASVLIVVAGMEGALPSVVAGLVGCPVIAVPTSIGYGASFKGISALLGMLNSCSSNVAVVNIDNGFGAGYMAAVINRLTI